MAKRLEKGRLGVAAITNVLIFTKKGTRGAKSPARVLSWSVLEISLATQVFSGVFPSSLARYD